MSDEWGPWRQHDGRGCPCAGMWVEVELANGELFEGSQPAAAEAPSEYNPWFWGNLLPKAWDYRVIRYRIRKPRALQDLIKLVEELPEGVDA